MSNRLDPDQTRHFVGSDLDSNCLQRLSADKTCREIFKRPITLGLRGAQWLSGRVLDSRPRGRVFEPHRRHCVVVLEPDTFIPA